jgi:hypothetical protein
MKQNKKTITDLELKKLKITSNQLLEYFEIISESTKIEFDLGFEIALKLKSIIEKIEEANK